MNRDPFFLKDHQKWRAVSFLGEVLALKLKKLFTSEKWGKNEKTEKYDRLSWSQFRTKTSEIWLIYVKFHGLSPQGLGVGKSSLSGSGRRFLCFPEFSKTWFFVNTGRTNRVWQHKLNGFGFSVLDYIIYLPTKKIEDDVFFDKSTFMRKKVTLWSGCFSGASAFSLYLTPMASGRCVIDPKYFPSFSHYVRHHLNDFWDFSFFRLFRPFLTQKSMKNCCFFFVGRYIM